jgi:DNA mismatch repair ATPase MutS
MRVIGPLLLWRQQIAMRIEAWRQKTGSGIGGWIRAVGEFEALSSIAALAFERPEWSFPELVDGTPALFEALALRHPLLPLQKCVPNDVTLNAAARLLIVSGSNMSGKSTLLRSIGLNCALAWAGAPVAADRLRVAPLRMGASIRITDSLQDNRSRFLAEILRIRQIVGLIGQDGAVLFLLDELLSGTNSHDRLIGASGIVRGLLAGNSIGLLTTHDLALTQIESGQNVHFEDSIQDGELEFDYKLRPGIVTHGNALALMRAVGLEV